MYLATQSRGLDAESRRRFRKREHGHGIPDGVYNLPLGASSSWVVAGSLNPLADERDQREDHKHLVDEQTSTGWD